MIGLTYAEWGAGEYFSLAKAWASGRLRSGPEIARLTTLLENILQHRHILPVNYGRTALGLSLEAFRRRRPERSEVVVPAYICPSVIDKVRDCGLIPVAVDVTGELNLDPARVAEVLSDRTLAVIAAHMYGAPAPVDALEDLCRRRGVYLVDDAAQVIGVELNGRPLGTFGDTGLVSFCQSKTIVAGNSNSGGILIVSDPELSSALQEAWQALPAGRYKLREFWDFLWNCEIASWSEDFAYYALTAGRRFMSTGDRRPDFTPRKMANATAAIARRQLRSLPQRLRGRRQIAATYARVLAAQSAIEIPQFQPERYLSRIVLTLPEGIDAASAQPALRRRGLYCRLGYPVFDADGRCDVPKARALQRRLIEVPSHSAMDEAEVRRVYEILAGFVERAAGR